MKHLIDGDILGYIASCVSERMYYISNGKEYNYKRDIPSGQEHEEVREPYDNLYLYGIIESILYPSRDHDITIMLSGKSNFRLKVDPNYKANRKNLTRPVLLKEARKYLSDNYRTIYSLNCEADDLLGMYSSSDTIIVSSDKDLKMIPATHSAKMNANDTIEVDELGGFKWFCTQVLTGDPVDNIKGLKGIGAVRSARILSKCTTKREMWIEVILTYKEKGELHRLHQVAQLIWIARPLFHNYNDYIRDEVLYEER